MLYELKKHKYAYTILVMGLLTAVTFFLGVWPDRFKQRLVVLALGFFYFIWGISTHFKSTHLTREIVYEYLGASILGVIVLLLLTV